MSALVVSLLVAPVARATGVPNTLRFVAPSGHTVNGTTDLRVNAPAGTTAVRFYFDDVALSEVTDLYARQTRTDPVWATATDASWFEPGRHTLRAEADTATGMVSTTKQVVVRPSVHAAGGMVALNGGWRFSAAGDLPSGSLDGDRPPATTQNYDASLWPKIVVPDSLGAVKARWNDDNGLLGIYRKTIDLPAPRRGERTALVFDSCFWACRYFVNGVPIGSSTGGYLPTRLDATDAVRRGANTIAVIVDNRVATMGEYAAPVKGLYWNWGGILQQVHLERTPAVALTDTRAEGTLAGRLTVRPSGINASTAAQPVHALLTVDGPHGSRVLGPTHVQTVVPPGGGATSPITVSVPRPRPWDLDHPNLYTVHLEPTGSAAWHQLSERTGFRDVSVAGKDLLLNGKPVEDLQGFDRHADYPGLGRTQPDGLADREMKALHDKGFRIFRPAHYPTTPAELAAADKYGLLVIEEVNNITSQPASVLGEPGVHDFAKSVLDRMVARDRSHPSLFAWSVGNENATDTTQGADYVRDVIAYGKSVDPSRLYTQVTDHPTTDRAYPYEDFLAENYYAGWYSGTVDAVGSMLDTVQAATGKPIMISEYGAEAVAGRHGTDRGSEWYQAYIVDGYNRQLDTRPHFIGKMYWTTTEFWCTPTWSGGNPDPVPPFHTKALETYFRQPKLGWRVMFSPVRITRATVLQAPLGERSTLHQRVTIADVHGHGARGTVVTDAPPGFRASRVPFRVAPGGTTTVTVRLTGTLNADNRSATGFARAVIDSDTEALPMPFTIASADTVRSPASDRFDSPQLDSAWQVVRPQAHGWGLTDRPGSLRLSTLAGGETGSVNNGPNMFVRTDTPQSDYTATATLDAPGLSADFQQVGLYAYAGDDDYVKADLGWVDGRRALEFIAESGATIGTRTSVPYQSDSVTLRLVRHGTTVAAEYSSDGQDWYPLGTAELTGTARVALQAVGGSASPPAIPTYVRDLDVRTSGTVELQSVAIPDQPLFTGEPGQALVTVANGSSHAVAADARVDLPSGWTSGTVAGTVPPFGATTLAVPLTPSGTPDVATIAAQVTAGGVPVYGRAAAQAVSAPRGDRASLALDAGTPTSPALTTYSRLSPSDAWDATKGFGWVGTAPTARDRGALDTLSRDIVTNTAPGTLRLQVPAGTHTAYLLIGDRSFASDAMTVSAGDQTVVALDRPLPTGTFQWFNFTLDGGSSGRDVDLDFTANIAGQFWRFAGLVLDG